MEGILVIISFVFLCTVNVLMWTRNPNSNFLDWYTGKGLRFEKSRLSAYVRVVSIVGLISAVCGFLLSQSYQSALGFAAINMAIMAASGVNLILYKDAK